MVDDSPYNLFILGELYEKNNLFIEFYKNKFRFEKQWGEDA